MNSIPDWAASARQGQESGSEFFGATPAILPIASMSYRIRLMLFRLAVLLLQRAKLYTPQVISGYATLLQWLRSMMNQQKRLGKNDRE